MVTNVCCSKLTIKFDNIVSTHVFKHTYTPSDIEFIIEEYTKGILLIFEIFAHTEGLFKYLLSSVCHSPAPTVLRLAL